MKNNKIKEIVGFVILGIVFGCLIYGGLKINKKNKMENFYCKFQAAREVEEQLEYDYTNRIISEKEKITKHRGLIQIYKKIGETAPNEIREEYKEYIDSDEVIAVKYASAVEYNYNQREEKLDNLIDKISEVSMNVNMEELSEYNSEIGKYVEKYNLALND